MISKALVHGVDFVYNQYGRRSDPKDLDPAYAEILYKSHMEAEAELPVPWTDPEMDIPALQKKILKERYGIDYRTFHELNPEVQTHV